MANLNGGDRKFVGTKPGLFKGWNILLGLGLVAAFAVAPTFLGLADSGGVKGHTFDISFTKWVTTPPNMEGVVGGDVGTGTFAGEIQGMSNVGNMTNLDAVYHINGSLHSFDATIKAAQDNSAGTGVITGTVDEGWLKGGSLTGEYKVIAVCPIDTGAVNYYGTACFQGTLHVRLGP